MHIDYFNRVFVELNNSKPTRFLNKWWWRFFQPLKTNNPFATTQRNAKQSKATNRNKFQRMRKFVDEFIVLIINILFFIYCIALYEPLIKIIQKNEFVLKEGLPKIFSLQNIYRFSIERTFCNRIHSRFSIRLCLFMKNIPKHFNSKETAIQNHSEENKPKKKTCEPDRLHIGKNPLKDNNRFFSALTVMSLIGLTME